MRKTKSYGRDRATLHRNHLADFKQWVEDLGGWKIMEPSGHEYEVFRIRRYDPRGDAPDIFFYRRNHTDHITVQKEAVPLVRAFLNDRKRLKAQRRTVDLSRTIDI